MGMVVLPTSLSVYNMHAWHRKRTLDPLELVIDGCQIPHGCWELKQSPLEEQPVIVTLSHLSSPPISFLI